jgi:heme a synthase
VFVTQVVIVGTGGIVRLTASGLGCPTWPRCTEDSFVSTPEMGLHGVIEFGNRLLFFVLQIVAIAGFILVLKMRKQRRDLFWLFLVSALSVFIQAIIGGITVLTQLNPYVVGLHYLASVVLVVVAAVLVYRVYEPPGPRKLVVSQSTRNVVWFTAGVGFATIILGIITTGAGPHAGDGGAARNGLDPAILQGIHAWLAYATFALTLIIWRQAHVQRAIQMRRYAVLTLGVMVAQIIIGLAQARLALPPVLVGIHMVLAVLLGAGTAMIVVTMRQRVRVADAPLQRDEMPCAP